MALIRHFPPGAVDTSSGLVRGVPGGGFEDVEAGGGATTYTATASLSAAIQQAQAATASLQAAIQSPQFVTASADAAIAQARTASADLQAAIQQARSATANADAAIQTTGSATASADAAIVAAMSLEASLDAYIQALAERYARPDADVSDGDWLPSTPGDLYAMLDEETASDTDYIYTTTASTCVIRLSDVADPATSTGHVIRFKVPSGFTPQGNLRVVLKQGATEIAEAHNGTISAGTLYEYTLTGTQADAITDYTDLTVTFAASDGVTWTPLELFAADEVGVWYDPSDFSTMWKDTAGTTPVTAVDDLVARIDDKSGNGFHATQATEANRPVLKQDGNGNYYLLFDGTNDGLVTGNIDFTDTDKMSVWAGVRKLSDSAAGAIVELTSSPSTLNTGTFYINASGGALENYEVYMRWNGGRNFYRPATFAAPITNTIALMLDNSGVTWPNGNKPYVNGALEQDGGASNTTSASTFSNAPLYIGRRAGSSNPFNGWLYALIVRGAVSSTDEFDEAEAWVNGKTEAY